MGKMAKLCTVTCEIEKKISAVCLALWGKFTTYQLSLVHDDEAWSVLLRFQGDRPISKLVIGWVPAYSGWVPTQNSGFQVLEGNWTKVFCHFFLIFLNVWCGYPLNGACQSLLQNPKIQFSVSQLITYSITSIQNDRFF